MAKRMDFTHGNIVKQLIIFSGPIMLTNLLQTSFQFIDSLWIGNLLGADALGAVAVSSAIIFTMLSFVIGLNNATLTILSQQIGMNSKEGLRRYLNAFVVVLTTLAIIFTILGFVLSEQMLKILGTPAEILPLANSYLRITFSGILFLFGYNFISTVLRAIGDSKSPLRFVIIAVVLNTFLDPLFISGFNLGIEGAALATIVSQGIAFIYGMVYVLRNKLVPFQLPYKPLWIEVRLILHLGVPAGLQMAVISAGVAAIMSVVTSFGSAVVGGFGAAQRIDSLIMLPAQALGTAVNSMAGQNIGQGNWKRVHQIAKYGLIYNFLIMIAIGIGVVIFAEYMVLMFTRDVEAVQFATMYLRIMAISFPLLGVNFILNGIVRASGAMYQVLVLNMISFWILRYPLTYLFAAQFGEIGIALGHGVSFFISSLLAAGYYLFGKWKEKELFKS